MFRLFSLGLFCSEHQNSIFVQWDLNQLASTIPIKGVVRWDSNSACLCCRWNAPRISACRSEKDSVMPATISIKELSLAE
jgi:hypothetical protein